VKKLTKKRAKQWQMFLADVGCKADIETRDDAIVLCINIGEAPWLVLRTVHGCRDLDIAWCAARAAEAARRSIDDAH